MLGSLTARLPLIVPVSPVVVLVSVSFHVPGTGRLRSKVAYTGPVWTGRYEAPVGSVSVKATAPWGQLVVMLSRANPEGTVNVVACDWPDVRLNVSELAIPAGSSCGGELYAPAAICPSARWPHGFGWRFSGVPRSPPKRLMPLIHRPGEEHPLT